ncbi:hypothetical protein AZI86_02350 [Bdellovibrio bacteriovorus]|uniref:Uncharacterized protein n=1 Tax=Bdellovibrio bacteriovorus TaxID=959 RepID=A0A150WN89_BDEBC|nr:hypothetical protein [Bdellovibrio bacteriovorus]KYG65932.1 hypothetical protein AZI86_02350 [Bdellovibrio bacteriovorus]
MSQSLNHLFESHTPASPEGGEFLKELERSISQDLWKSAGGPWSESSENIFRQRAMEKLAKAVHGTTREDYQKAWNEVVRDFHQNYWGEKRLLKKEKKPKTEEQKIFWELFSYIWMMLQATLVVKTAVFYFGIKSANEDSTEGKIYVTLAILFSFVSLFFFAYRKSKKNKDPR